MRLRLPELLESRGLTPYAFAKALNGRVAESTAYRLVEKRGKLASFDAALLEALCDVLGCKPGDLFERDGKRGRR